MENLQICLKKLNHASGDHALTEFMKLYTKKETKTYLCCKFVFWQSWLQGVNFINVLRAHFLYESLLSSFFLLTWLHVAREKLPKRLSYKKCVRKLLMKLTQGRICSFEFEADWQTEEVNFNNIFWAAFALVFLLPKNYKAKL